MEDGRSGRQRAGLRHEVEVRNMNKGTVARAAVQVVEDGAVATTGENPLTVARTAASTAGRRSKRR